MSKKDYQAIAAALYRIRLSAVTRPEPMHSCAGVEYIDATAMALADVLGAANPRFDRGRFIQACETGSCRGMKA